MKWLPPIGTFRCQIRVPSVMIGRSVWSGRRCRAGTTELLEVRALELVGGDEVVGEPRSGPSGRCRPRSPRARGTGGWARLLIWSRFMLANRPDLGHREVVVALLLVADLLVGPDDLLQREGDLLLGLELDDIRDPLLLDGRELDELDQAGLPGDADGDLAALQVVAVHEGGERLADEGLGVGVGLAEDLGVLDVVERLGHDLIRVIPRDELQRLQGRLADVEGPDGLDLRHSDHTPGGVGAARDGGPGPRRARSFVSCRVQETGIRSGGANPRPTSRADAARPEEAVHANTRRRPPSTRAGRPPRREAPSPVLTTPGGEKFPATSPGRVGTARRGHFAYLTTSQFVGRRRRGDIQRRRPRTGAGEVATGPAARPGRARGPFLIWKLSNLAQLWPP